VDPFQICGLLCQTRKTPTSGTFRQKPNGLKTFSIQMAPNHIIVLIDRRLLTV
jgi:hypothetical protein